MDYLRELELRRLAQALNSRGVRLQRGELRMRQLPPEAAQIDSDVGPDLKDVRNAVADHRLVEDAPEHSGGLRRGLLGDPVALHVTLAELAAPLEERVGGLGPRAHSEGPCVPTRGRRARTPATLTP